MPCSVVQGTSSFGCRSVGLAEQRQQSRQRHALFGRSKEHAFTTTLVSIYNLGHSVCPAIGSESHSDFWLNISTTIGHLPHEVLTVDTPNTFIATTPSLQRWPMFHCASEHYRGAIGNVVPVEGQWIGGCIGERDSFDRRPNRQGFAQLRQCIPFRPYFRLWRSSCSSHRHPSS